MVDVEKLIKEVRKFPVLYDQTSDKYKHSEYKENIWNNISIALKVKGGIEECKKKWSSVRDQLRRTLQKRKTLSGQAAVRYRKYKYEESLKFLIPHIVDRDTLSNVPNLEEYQDKDDEGKIIINDTQEEISEHTYQLRNTRTINEEPENEFQNQFTDSTDSTLQSTAATLADTSSFFENKDKFGKPVVSLKRKVYREGEPIDSATSLLMAYILSEKEGRNKKMKTSVQDTVNHSVDTFLCLIAPTLKSLNPILLNQAKCRIFSMVQEFEMKQLIMSNEDKGVRVPNDFVPVSPSLVSQSASTLSTITMSYPSPLSVETTNMNVKRD